MTWGLKRQIFYVSVLIIFFTVFGFILIYPTLNKAPTCADGKQNGTESGVDCGGSCLRACTFQADQVSVLWARSFEVVPGRYNAVAYLENHNKLLAVDKIRYSFRFADKDNLYLGRRQGVAYVPPGRSFAVFERGIELGTAEPVYTTFEFAEAPMWLTVPAERINQLQIFVSDVNLEEEATAPHLSATLKNNSLFNLTDINAVAILYDKNHNAISASSTFVDELKGEGEQVVDFTWPEPFSASVLYKEILPTFNIFRVKLK